jgi:hypothetical protein
MSKEAKEQLNTLFKNLDVYYVDELENLLLRINLIRKEIEKMGNIIERCDVYNITILIEEIKIVSTCFFNKSLIKLCKKIHEPLNAAQSVFDLNELNQLIKLIDNMLLEFQIEIEDFFKKKISLLKSDITIDDFLSSIIDSINIKYKCNHDIFSQKPCITYLSSDTEESLYIKYKNYFSNIRLFVKNNQPVSHQLPLNKNPVIDLIKLGYCIHIEAAQIRYVCDSDSIILSASSEVLDKKDIHNFIEQNSYDNNNLHKKELLPGNISGNDKLREIFNYGIFSISQYFSDFNISTLLGISQNEKISELSFLGCAEQFKLLPELFLSDTDILNMINNKSNLFEGFIRKITNHNKPILPLDILVKFTNLYFHYNTKSATYINLEIYKGNSNVINKLSEVENIYSKICSLIERHDHVSKNYLKEYLAYIESFLANLDTFYESCLEKEDQIFQKISSGNFSILENILTVYKVKNYKEILEAKNNTEDSEKINSQFSEIEKAILNGKLRPSEDCSINLIFSVFKNSYYNTPKLLSFRELPPISHDVALMIEKTINNSTPFAINDILKLNNSYWRA